MWKASYMFLHGPDMTGPQIARALGVTIHEVHGMARRMRITMKDGRRKDEGNRSGGDA